MHTAFLNYPEGLVVSCQYIMNRERVFTAVIQNGRLVMLKVDEKNRIYWTLPGGGVEVGERREETAVREAKEEANIDIKIVRYLFENDYSAGTEYCYLAEPSNDHEISLGYDPELKDQVLSEVEWKDINDVRNDKHVSQVIKYLSNEELKKYNIVF